MDLSLEFLLLMLGLIGGFLSGLLGIGGESVRCVSESED